MAGLLSIVVLSAAASLCDASLTLRRDGRHAVEDGGVLSAEGGGGAATTAFASRGASLLRSTVLSDKRGKPNDKKMAAMGGGAGGTAAGKGKKEEEKKDTPKFKMKWLTFWYWKPLILTMMWLVFMIDVMGPVLDKAVEFSLVTEVALLCITIYGFAFIVFWTLNTKAAGSMPLVVVSTIGCTMCLLIWLAVVGLKMAKKTNEDPVVRLFTDVAELIRPLLRLILVAIMLDVVVKEASVDFGQLALLLGYAMLGITLSLAGVIGDVMAHVFIRLDGHFTEGDYLIYDGSLVQIHDIRWRHTLGITEATNSVIYIPNSELTSMSLINQTQDNDRSTEVDIPINVEAGKLEEALKNAWDILNSTGEEGFTFTGINGRKYENQFETDDCQIWVSEDSYKVHFNFVGKHFFSNPPPWEGESEEEPPKNRQRQWEHAWQMQIEWYLLEVKRRNEKLGEWPRY